MLRFPAGEQIAREGAGRPAGRRPGREDGTVGLYLKVRLHLIRPSCGSELAFLCGHFQSTYLSRIMHQLAGLVVFHILLFSTSCCFPHLVVFYILLFSTSCCFPHRLQRQSFSHNQTSPFSNNRVYLLRR